jgi:hypothetical protein
MYQNLRAKNLAPKLDGGGHVEHHAETYDDMMLKVPFPPARPPARMCGCAEAKRRPPLRAEPHQQLSGSALRRRTTRTG